MTDTLFDQAELIIFGILLIWSVVLIWATWQLRRLFGFLIEERRALRRWKRLQGLQEKQRQPWN